MNELQKQDLLERYIEGSLTKQENHLFENLRIQDPTLQEDIDFFQRFEKVKFFFGKDLLKKELISLETSLQKEETPSMLSKLTVGIQGIVKKANYTIDELVKMFLPDPEYQTVLAYTNRGSNLKVLSPENGIDASIEGLNFRLQSKIKKSVQLIIEDNHKQMLLSISITSFDNDFFVDVGEFLPGRYYWKLVTENETFIREFFIQKELMNS